MQIGVDVERARDLADAVGEWQRNIEPIVDLIAGAELLADLPSNAIVGLQQIGADGRAMAAAIRGALHQLTSFQIEIATPFEALVLDIAVGSHFERGIASEARSAGQTYRQAQIMREVAELGDRPGGLQADSVRELLKEYRSIDPAQRGDSGGALSVEVRDPFRSAAADDLNRGISIVSHALGDTADPAQIQVDEFQAIMHDNGRVTLVLPGVIDLSSPDLGYDADTASLRDADQEAVGSLTSTDPADNGYARIVREFVRQQVTSGALAAGSEVLIVGHSFGADTALDLVSDPAFNGELVTVTHVVAAAFHSEPQIDDVQPGTQVGVLQNIYDLPVIGEEIGHDLLTFSPGDLVPIPNEGILRLGVEGGEEIVGAGAHIVNGGAWMLEQAANVVTGFFGSRPVDIPNVPTDIEFIEDQVTPIGNGFIAEFEGGFQGAGHHQTNYINYVLESDVADPVTDFFVGIGAAGFGADGVTLAVDISRHAEVEDYAGPPPVPNPGPIPPAPVTSPPIESPASTPAPTPTPTRTPAPTPTPAPVVEPDSVRSQPPGLPD